MFSRKSSETGEPEELRERDETGAAGTTGEASGAPEFREARTADDRPVTDEQPVIGGRRLTDRAGAGATGRAGESDGREGFDTGDGFGGREGLGDRDTRDAGDGLGGREGLGDREGFGARDAGDGRDGRDAYGARDSRDGLGHRDEAVGGETFAGVDEEFPRSAARAAEEARPDGTGRTTSDLYGDRERMVRRERALSRERDLRHDAERHGTDGSGAAAGVRRTGSGRTGFDKAVPAVADGRLMPQAESEEFGRRLQGALTHFVDDPGRSVEEAARVLEETARRLSAALEERPRAMRATWDTRGPAGSGSGDGKDAKAADTERLRLALRTYRETTERLLEI